MKEEHCRLITLAEPLEPAKVVFSPSDKALGYAISGPWTPSEVVIGGSSDDPTNTTSPLL